MVYPNNGLLHSTKHDSLTIKLINFIIKKKESEQRYTVEEYTVQLLFIWKLLR